MTIQQVTTQIRQYGMVATWQANYEEWRVNYRRDDSRYNGINTVYYTSDAGAYGIICIFNTMKMPPTLVPERSQKLIERWR